MTEGCQMRFQDVLRTISNLCVLYTCLIFYSNEKKSIYLISEGCISFLRAAFHFGNEKFCKKRDLAIKTFSFFECV